VLQDASTAATPTAVPEPNVTPLAAAATAPEQGGSIEAINRRRSIIRSYTEAVVNDAVAPAPKLIAQGQFDTAADRVAEAQRKVNEAQFYLGEELYRQYTQRLSQTADRIQEARTAREKESAGQRRQETARAQVELRHPEEMDRQNRIKELMERAKAYWKQQQYQASLGQLQALLAIDPLSDEALTLKQMVQDMIYLRKQLEIDPLSARQRTETLQNADEAGVPYADEITYPKDWQEVMTRGPSSAPSPTPSPTPPGSTETPKMEARVYDISDLVDASAKQSARNLQGMGMMGGMGGMGGMGMGGKNKNPEAWEFDGNSRQLKGEAWNPPTPYDSVATGSVRASGPRSALNPALLASVTEDEIWVIARERPQRPRAPGPEYDTPGSGAMLARIQEKKVPLPLKHTDVKGKVSGYIATVEVVQQFQNPFSEKIEAVYVFPLPENAAVNEFIMVIGTRRIRGIIRERQEAEQIYLEARRQGCVASLLTQERPNIFTQKVANIEPGKAIDVHIKYFNTLAYADGWYEFTFPMVVGPRFNPPCSTDGVGAVGRGHAGLSGQSTEVQYLKPNERSGHDISLAVDLDAGVKIEEIACNSHAIKESRHGSEKIHVQLSPLDNIPNKDFVLRFKVAGSTIKSALVTHRDERGGFFTLMLYPPQDLEHVKRAPMEMVFVLDCSGSMNGQPIAKSKEAVKRALRKLGPDDTFQVIRFSAGASQLGPNPVPATPENVQRALAYVDALEGKGSTKMIEGIKAALDFPHDPRRFRLVSFMTDGYIGNEAEILGEIHKGLGDARIFCFGIGTSVNRYLLDRMAKLGKGAVAYIGLNDSGTEAVDRFYDCISHPALTDVQIDWGNMQVAEVYPKQVPDLFVGRPIILTGRFKGTTRTTIRIAGCGSESEEEICIPVEFDRAAPTHPGLACVWARKRIEDLNGRMIIHPYEKNLDLSGEIKQVALQYGLMSAYTAFLAVDSARTTQGDHGVTVAVPVPVPDGVRYDTTVQD
jgi:Ca-activated chloride channel family protein